MREADCAIRLHRPHQHDLIQRKLFKIHIHAYASEDYLKHYGCPKTLDDLNQHRILSYGSPIPHHLTSLNWLKTAGLINNERRTHILEINNLIGLKEAACKDMGIAILPDYLIGQTTNLIPILQDVTNIEPFDTYFCYPISLKNSARINAFRDFLLAQSINWHY